MNNSIINHLKSSAANSPSAPAILGDGLCVSYAELDAMSDKVALALESMGVASGQHIGIYMDKSARAIASIYAIFKSGCCYVPVSPDNPIARTEYMLENCGIRVILVAERPNDDLVKGLRGKGVEILDVGRLISADKQPQETFSPRKVVCGDPAAILHTSGSTGKPKAAVITHGNLTVFSDWAVSEFNLRSDDRLLSHAPLQFDLSFFDMFAAVAASAAVVLALPADTANAMRMTTLVNQSGVTVWQSVPSALTLQTLVDQKQLEAMKAVRAVLFAGERMPRQTLLRLPEAFPNARLFNVYGCTETNDTFMYPVPTKVAEAPDPLPIGKVLPHIDYRIVDESGRDVEPGQQGHLQVSGDTVMSGYLGDPNGELTEEGYYPTKDMVLVGTDGLVYFHGRVDSVVKTKGYRVNLMEIEDYLRKSGKFDELALFCVADDLIGSRIIAVVRPRIGETCSPLDMKIYCAQGLPKYAIPHSFYITREELPKGSTGKIDKRGVAYIWQRANAGCVIPTMEGETNHELT